MKRNSFKDMVFSLFLRIAVTSIICFFLALFAVSAAGTHTLPVLIQLLELAGALALTYSCLHDKGMQDSVLAGTARPRRPLTGLLVGLTANSPFILSGIVLILFKAFSVGGNYMSYYKILNAYFFPLNYSLLPVDMTPATVGWGDVMISFSTLFIIPLIAMFSYILGLEKFSFNELVFYKKKTADEQ